MVDAIFCLRLAGLRELLKFNSKMHSFEKQTKNGSRVFIDWNSCAILGVFEHMWDCCMGVRIYFVFFLYFC